VPAFRASRFRREDPSRWNTTWTLPQTQTVPIGLGTLEFTTDYHHFNEAQLGGDEPELARGIDVGARVDLFLPSVDLGFSFLATRDKIPSYNGFRLSNTGDVDGDGSPDHVQTLIGELDITPYHERLLVPGFDMAVNVGRLVVKAEAAYFHTQDPDSVNCLIDDPYVKYAAGVEVVLPNITGDFDLAIRAQYNGDVALSSEEQRDAQEAACPDGQLITIADPEVGLIATDFESGLQATPHIRHPYTHGFYWNVNMAFTPSIALDLRGFFDVAGDALLQAHLQAMLLEHLELTVGTLVMLDTGEDTIFTPYARNHRVEVGLSYLF